MEKRVRKIARTGSCLMESILRKLSGATGHLESDILTLLLTQVSAFLGDTSASMTLRLPSILMTRTLSLASMDTRL
jgi:hypothetical protein